MPSLSVTDPWNAMVSARRSPSGAVNAAWRHTASRVSDNRRNGAPRWILPASTMWEARNRADGVTMRLRMPDGSMLTTGVSSKIRAPARRASAREAVDVFAAVDLKRLRIIHAVEIMVGPQLGADAIDLPALHFRPEILAEHLQAGDQFVADFDVGHLERAFAERYARHRFLGRIRPDEFGAFARQRPEVAGILEADVAISSPIGRP